MNGMNGMIEAKKFKKRPVAIEAMQLIGAAGDTAQVLDWLAANRYPMLVGDYTKPETLRYHDQVPEDDSRPDKGLYIDAAAAEWGRVYTEVGPEHWPPLCAWVESGDYVAEGDTDLPSVSDFEERYQGHWDSFREYAEQLADDIGLLADVPEEIARYFDWQTWSRDLAMDYSTYDDPEGGVFVFRVM